TTNLQLLPIAVVTSGWSSSIDNAHQKYYFCKGDSLLTLDPVSGNLVSITSLGMPAGSTFLFTQFYPCDSSIYGIINNPPFTYTFARFSPSTGIMTSLSTFQNTSGYIGGGLSVIDETTHTFIVQYLQNNLLGLDLFTGQIIYNTPIVNLPGEFFGHIVIKCSDQLIYGTSAVPATAKYLATIDPLTGIVTHISNTSWNIGVWKPDVGGACINQLTGNYYYSGSLDVLVGASTISGSMIASFNLSSGNAFLFLEHFSQCPCNTTGTEENNLSFNTLNIFPNPSASGGTIRLTFNTKHNAPAECEIVNVMGERVLTALLRVPLTPKGEPAHMEIDVSGLAKGVYVVRVGDGVRRENKKLVIE